MERRTFLKAGGSTIAAAALSLGLYGGEFERHSLEIKQHTVTLKGLGDSLHGLRIVQISDIHYDEFSEPFYVREVVRRVNGLLPDVVLMTGDFVSYAPFPKSFGARHSNPCAALLSSIECSWRFAVMGNHDAGVGVKTVIDALHQHGIPVLENRYVPIERGGDRLWIAGCGDVTAHMARVDQAVPSATVRGKDPVILMVHEPDFADEVAAFGGVDLMVSGHTHGGQIRLPFFGPVVLPLLGQHYPEGFYQVGPTLLYVNRGIGTVGMPVRILCRPEITVFTLSAGA